jgi:RNA polymerase-interacting CarD/CdnL/TRCF family regulator
MRNIKITPHVNTMKPETIDIEPNLNAAKRDVLIYMREEIRFRMRQAKEADRNNVRQRADMSDVAKIINAFKALQIDDEEPQDMKQFSQFQLQKMSTQQLLEIAEGKKSS